jgi:hypothetical protein
LNEDFKCYLEKSTAKKDIQQSIMMIKEVEAFLGYTDKNKDFSQANVEDLRSVVKYLIENRKNSKKNLIALLEYSRFVGNRKIEIVLLELLDGSDILRKLVLKVNRAALEKQHDKILGGIPLPTLGTYSTDKPKTTKKFMENLEAKLGEGGAREVLLSGPHAGPKKEYLPERKAFLESEDIDDFLQKRHKEYVQELEQHMNEHTLYFTQEIDEDVIDYVRNTPTCQNGVKQGNVIYVTKIPYMAKKYLKEKDPKMKRYYYCHCPWVRDAIKSGIRISSNFCYCSAGYEKRPWDVIFDQSVRAEVLETVLKGDLVCRFAIHIPEEYSDFQLFKQGKNQRKKVETSI